jgi:hypothetical protein
MYFLPQSGQVISPVRWYSLGEAARWVWASARAPAMSRACSKVSRPMRFVGVGDVHVAVGDVAYVGGVVEDPCDGVPGPRFAGAVAHAALVEFGGDGPGTEPLLGVDAEDVAQDRSLLCVGYEFLGVAVDVVSVGSGAAGPFSFGCFGSHSVDHSVDDGFSFEFGEDAEELHEHPADRGGRVEWFGGGAERDSGVVEFVQEIEEVGEASGESVDAYDEEHVVLAGFGGAEGTLQVGAVGGGAGGVVGEFLDEGPAGLRGDVGAERGELGVDGEGLVFVICGAPGVDRDAAEAGFAGQAGGAAFPASGFRGSGCHRPLDSFADGRPGSGPPMGGVRGDGGPVVDTCGLLGSTTGVRLSGEVGVGAPVVGDQDGQGVDGFGFLGGCHFDRFY